MVHGLSPNLRAFCEQKELLRLAYLNSEYYSRAVPMWVVMIDGPYYVGTCSTGAKWKAMRRYARVGLVIEGDTESLQRRVHA